MPLILGSGSRNELIIYHWVVHEQKLIGKAVDWDKL